MAVNPAGEAYLTGWTIATSLPTTPGAFQPSIKPASQNGFVSKFNNLGSRLVYSTYLGGSTNSSGKGIDYPLGIALDSSGNAIVTGNTESTDFPLTSGALSTQNNIWIETLYELGSFVTKLNSTGSDLLYSTYLGGSGDVNVEQCDCTTSIATDSSGNVYLTGVNVSTDFPITPGAFQTLPFSQGAFVTKFNGAEMTVLPATTTAVTANANPQIAGSPVVFSVVVHGTGSSTPSGIVGVSVNGNSWKTYTLDQTGSVSYSTSILPAGTDTVVTYYLGDSKNAPSTNYLDVSITPGSGKLPVTITAVPSQNPVPYGNPVTFDITVTDPSGKGIPAGTLELDFLGWPLYQNTELYKTQLDEAGHVRFTTKSLPAGADTMNALFVPSNANYAGNYLQFVENVTPLGVVPTPVISPVSGNYTTPPTVTITDSDPSSKIYYTVDGSTPIAVGNTYSKPLTFSSSTTVKAIAARPGYASSSVATATYQIGPLTPAPAPTIAPAPGTYTSAQQVTMTDSLSGASIYYTLDGTAPTVSSTRYTTAVSVSSTATVTSHPPAIQSTSHQQTFLSRPLRPQCRSRADNPRPRSSL
jgi:hypothetical protein